MTWSIGLSTGACTDHPIVEVLDAFHPSGVHGVELGTPPRHFDPWQNGQVTALAARLRLLALEPVSIHAPFGARLDLADPNPHHRHAAVGAILTAADALKRVGGRVIVVHPSDLVRHGQDAGARLDDCVHSLSMLAESCRQEGLTLAVESPLPHLIGGHPDEFRSILRRLDPAVRVCLDTGHTSLGGFWDRFMEVADGRLTHVHASDNRGTYDDHLPPGEGRLDWRHISDTLRAAAFSGWIMLELKCPTGDLTSYFTSALRQAEVLLPRG